jgi:hypothetical protein
LGITWVAIVDSRHEHDGGIPHPLSGSIPTKRTATCRRNGCCYSSRTLSSAGGTSSWQSRIIQWLRHGDQRARDGGELRSRSGAVSLDPPAGLPRHLRGHRAAPGAICANAVRMSPVRLGHSDGAGCHRACSRRRHDEGDVARLHLDNPQRTAPRDRRGKPSPSSASIRRSARGSPSRSFSAK